MDGITAVAAKEVMTVLFNTEISLFCKIPYKLIEILEQKAEEYQEMIYIRENTSLIDQPISEDAKAILTLMYKDFWCNEEEREKLNEEIAKNEEAAYDPFKNVKTGGTVERIEVTFDDDDDDDDEKITALAVPMKWYEKIFDKIKAFLSRLKNNA